jgi:hypothetical protein
MWMPWFTLPTSYRDPDATDLWWVDLHFPLWSIGLAFILRRFYPHLSLRILFGLSFWVAWFISLTSLILLGWCCLAFQRLAPGLGIIFITVSSDGFLAAPLLLSIPRRVGRTMYGCLAYLSHVLLLTFSSAEQTGSLRRDCLHQKHETLAYSQISVMFFLNLLDHIDGKAYRESRTSTTST